MKQTDIWNLLTDPAIELAWATGAVLESVSLVRKPDHWLMVIKAKKPGKKTHVAFIAAPTPYDCYELLYTATHTKSLTLKWTESKY